MSDGEGDPGSHAGGEATGEAGSGRPSAGGGRPGALEPLAPGVWRLPLASRTLPPHRTTNSYLIVDRGVGWLVDAGFAPDDTHALATLLAALDAVGLVTLKGLLLTHTHPDHWAGAATLQRHFAEARRERLPVYVHPEELARLALPGEVRALRGGRRLTAGDLTLHARHTPGHSPGHLCFEVPEVRVALVGDLLAGEGSTWVGVPEGDVRAYLASLQGLQALALRALGPGHGALVRAPEARIAEVRAHRLERERQVLAALQHEALRLDALRERVYPELPPAAWEHAERSLLAHLVKLMAEMRVVHLGSDARGPYRARR